MSYPLIKSPQDAHSFLEDVIQYLHHQGYIVVGSINIIPPSSSDVETCLDCNYKKLRQHACPHCSRIRRLSTQQQASKVATLLATPAPSLKLLTHKPSPPRTHKPTPNGPVDTSAPPCPVCGQLGIRKGNCYVCPECGESIGGCS
jgi:hypothetical protein